MEAPPFILRPAAAADYEWLWNLKRTTMRPYVEQTWGTWDDIAQEQYFRANFSSDTVQIVVLDGRNGGLLHVEYESGAIFLANIQVHPEFQNRGLGSAVIRSLLETAQSLRLPVRLQVLKVNASAQRLYSRLGFVSSGETHTHQLMRWHPK